MLVEGHKIQEIINSSYLHIEHYGDYSGTKTADEWARIIRGTKQAARAHLMDVIEQQEEKERIKLDQLFQGTCSPELCVKAGFSEESASFLSKTFNEAKTGSSIEEKINALNQFITHKIISDNYINSQDVAGTAINIIQNAFEENQIAGFNLEKFSIEELHTFISSLYSVAKAIDIEANKKENEGLIRDSLQAAVRKLNGAIRTYLAEYKKKVNARQQSQAELNKIFSNMSEFIDTKKSKNWNRKPKDATNFEDVQTIIKRSAHGYLTQAGGQAYEKYALNTIREACIGMFRSSMAGIPGVRGSVIGGKKDELGTFQKADIELDISLESKNIEPDYFQITFSVKKKSNNASIEVHNGGSLFSYADRFASMGAEAAGADFSFLNNGNFQYVYVNENMHKGKNNSIVEAIKEMLKGAGYLFLGEEIQSQTGRGAKGADFLFINGRIYAFSTILKKIAEDENNIDVRLDINATKQPLKGKSEEIRTTYRNVPPSEYYGENFMTMSKRYGQEVLKGAAFKINLKADAYKV